VSCDTVFARFLTVTGLALWTAIIFVPLVMLFVPAIFLSTESETNGRIFAAMSRSFGLASIIAGVAVVLGWVPGRLLGTSRHHKDLLLLLLLAPLVLPRYVLYYAWTLLLSPTTKLGSYLSSDPELARFVGTFSSCSVLISWYWPLAALLMAQGWRNIDRQIWDSASLDADAFGIFKKITLPLLARPLLLAFGVCLVLSLSEFATFHLAGVSTVGTELAVLYQLTGSESHVARAAWPVAGAALVLAIVLGKSSRCWVVSAPAVSTVEFESQSWRWVVLLALIGISLVVPVALLVTNVASTQALQQFLILHQDELGWSLAIAVVAAAMAHLIAFGAFSLGRIGSVGRLQNTSGPVSRARQLLSLLVRTSIFVAMFVPACLVAVSMVRMLAICNAPISLRQGWLIVSAGQASRFAGVALILLLLTRYAYQRHLSEMASLDGASSLAAWWHVHLPHTWPIFVGTFILIVMFSVTELSATMVLLPAGLPNFAQTLLNQMHYARDQQVIASCLVLVCLFLISAAVVVLLLRVMRMRQSALRMADLGVVILVGFVLYLAGCESKSYPTNGPKVVTAFGRTGRGPGEFIYPRAIEIASDRWLFVVDKTGRIQRFSLEGDFLDVIKMPQIEAGKPTGLSVAPNGKLYVADTHYHRVVIFSADGEMLDEFGQFGQENGCFIYPTDVALSPDGRIFVSEYGGNDRVSVFSDQGDFLYCFGFSGDGHGQLSRPAAVCIDLSRKRLYVADACNHRIAIYDYDGKLLRYIGSAGRGPGQLRYPYDLALLSEGILAVCEYGNNRIQLFDPDGHSLAVYGRAGRQLGQLAYPWGLAVDSRRRAFIVDAGNNRIQVWQLHSP
jgi:ABC-type Fe3+ transport system permease subunit/DNA-binding beta-propeller fold protein YncE